MSNLPTTVIPCAVLTVGFIALLQALRTSKSPSLYLLNATAVCGVAMVWLASALSEALSAAGPSASYVAASSKHGGYLGGALLIQLAVPAALSALFRKNIRPRLPKGRRAP